LASISPVLLVLSLAASPSLSYPSGPPPEVCETMGPHHSGREQQAADTNPYKLTVWKKKTRFGLNSLLGTFISISVLGQCQVGKGKQSNGHGDVGRRRVQGVHDSGAGPG
jgi:hypothetical protein